jgi:hypothetical protein
MGMKSYFIFKCLGLVFISSILMNCQQNPVGDLSPEDSQVFITNQDRSAVFSTYKTFSLPDSVVVYQNNTQQTSRSLLESSFINRISTALTSRGYQRVDSTSNPDLGIAVIRANESYIGATSIPYDPYYLDYWGGFGGGLGGFGYGYSPFFPTYYSFYEVQDRYWIIQMVDLKNRNETNKQLNVIWTAQIRGNGIFDDASIDRIVDAVFSQSDYLQTNQ